MDIPWTYTAPLGHRALENCSGRVLSLRANRTIVFILTFLCYTAYHASRKPPSIVKSVLHGDGDANNAIFGGHRRSTLSSSTHHYHPSTNIYEHMSIMEITGRALLATAAPIDPTYGGEVGQVEKHKNRTLPDSGEGHGWAPFNNTKIGKSLLGDLDLAFLGSYSLSMFVSGHLADRLDLRNFLTGGMLGSGVCVALFGAAFFWNIHKMGYFVVVQVIGGLLQATGWPSVVSIMANWYGSGKRGLIMGIWNAHTSVGNIVGSLIAAYMLKYGWGWSFIVPGGLMIAIGLLIYLFLVVEPQDIGFLPQSGSAYGSLAGSLPETPTGRNGREGMSDSERAFLERRVAQLAEERGGMVPARIAQSMEAHHHVHIPTGRHGMLAMGSTLIVMNERRDSVDGDSEDGDREALLGGISPASTMTYRTEKGGVGFLAAWCIPGVSIYAFALFFAKLTAYTFLYWLPYYINSTEVGGQRLTPTQAGNLSVLFDVGGVLGGVMAGHFKDASNSPAIVSGLFVYLAIPTLYLYRAYGEISFFLNITLMMLAGFFVNGPYALITTAVSADLGSNVRGNEKAMATVTAIIDGMGSVGAALGPMLTGYISELPGGFDNVFKMLYGASLCAGILLSTQVLGEFNSLLGLGGSTKQANSFNNNNNNTSMNGRGKSGRNGQHHQQSYAIERVNSASHFVPVIHQDEAVNPSTFAYVPSPGSGHDGDDVLVMTIDNESGAPTRINGGK